MQLFEENTRFKMRSGGMFDAHEFGKRVRRLIDGNYSYRKILVFIIVCGGILLYFGPSLAQWLFSSNNEPTEAFQDSCIKEKLGAFYFDTVEYNANILHNPAQDTDKKYLPYIGNGIFGVEITQDGWLYIRHGRTLLLPVHWQPLVSYSVPDGSLHREATVTHFTNGIVYKYQCLSDGYHIDSLYYAHRSLDGILVQDTNIVNPSSSNQEVALKLPVNMHWSEFEIKTVKILVDSTSHEYTLASGFVPSSDTNKMISISIVYKDPPKTVQVNARSSTKLKFLTSIQYSEPLLSKRYHVEREAIEKKAVENGLVNDGLFHPFMEMGSVKDKIPSSIRSNIVYRIPCKDCPGTYIRQKKDLKTRIQEHNKPRSTNQA